MIFTIASNRGADSSKIALLDLDTGESKTLLAGGSHAQYVNSGHLVYMAGGILHAVPFDLGTRAIRGTPVPVLQRLATVGAGTALLDVATDGTLVYVSEGGQTSRVPVWVDRKSREEEIKAPGRQCWCPGSHPTGGTLLLTVSPAPVTMTYGSWTWNEGPSSN